MLKYRHRVLGFLRLLSVITYLDRVAISVAGPRIQERLNTSPELWGMGGVWLAEDSRLKHKVVLKL